VKGNDQHFIVGNMKKVTLIEWDGQSPKGKLVRNIGEVETDMPDNRWNDAKVDPVGRFYGGTMRLEACGDIFEKSLGTFYRYSRKSGFVSLITNIGISNGLTWNKMMNKFYFIDSTALDIKEYDYDMKTGDICERLCILNLQSN
jgi:gluconolactonase